jgi:hypothetical protein
LWGNASARRTPDAATTYGVLSISLGHRLAPRTPLFSTFLYQSRPKDGALPRAGLLRPFQVLSRSRGTRLRRGLRTRPADPDICRAAEQHLSGSAYRNIGPTAISSVQGRQSDICLEGRGRTGQYRATPCPAFLNEQSLPVAWRSHDGILRCVQVAGCRLSLLPRRCV